MNRMFLIALTLAATLFMTDTATAAVYAKEAIDPVVFEGDPDMPSGANPNGLATVALDPSPTAGKQSFKVVESANTNEPSFARWWVALWRWAWSLR
ncbi:MAG: hypothetical protein DHS20C21_11340 [Gemmatimonadota bacterium]|nr:MAG: hypothetical protein DHS20C21_11340 [Gemmatimonadota bacterium]